MPEAPNTINRIRIYTTKILDPFSFFAIFAVQRPRRMSERYYRVLAAKLNDTPPEMATLVLLDSSGLEMVRPTPT